MIVKHTCTHTKVVIASTLPAIAYQLLCKCRYMCTLNIVFIISLLLQPLAFFCAPVIPTLAITCFFSSDTAHRTFYNQNTTKQQLFSTISKKTTTIITEKTNKYGKV